MDRPAIEYTRLDDGTNLACWAIGEGPALLHMPWWFLTHTEMAWRIPNFAWWYEELAKRYRVIHWDSRGAGLSDGDYLKSWDDMGEAEILGVARHFGVDRFALFSFGLSTPMALAFAARQPDRVSALIVWDGIPSQPRYMEASPFTASRPVKDRDFHQFLEIAMFQMVGSGVSIDDHARIIEMWESSIDLDRMDAYYERVAPIDVTDELASIRCPTMVAHRRDLRLFGDSLARELASGIAGSQLILLDGDSIYPFIGDKEEALKHVEAFLDEHLAEPERQITQGFRTLLFTDLESSTALTQAVGDAKAQEVLHGHNDAVRAALAAHDGEEVKHTGDGIFAAFGSAVAAVEAALQIQHDLAGAEVRVRIGLNAGEPIAEDDDYFGTAVQLAARLCDRAEPGQVLVSNVVRELCAGKTFAFTDQGEATLKGFSEPVRLFVVREGG